MLKPLETFSACSWNTALPRLAPEVGIFVARFWPLPRGVNKHLLGRSLQMPQGAQGSPPPPRMAADTRIIHKFSPSYYFNTPCHSRLLAESSVVHSRGNLWSGTICSLGNGLPLPHQVGGLLWGQSPPVNTLLD